MIKGGCSLSRGQRQPSTRINKLDNAAETHTVVASKWIEKGKSSSSGNRCAARSIM